MVENLLSEWAFTLFASLADAGVRDVVSSPGSRSTPFVAGALRESRLRIHDVIDERAAAFFALGQARVTGVPTVLLCTSGSAPAHYFPAVVEANAAMLPLIVLSSDRPTELMDCGAPQTINQTKLFGDHVRKFFDVGMPEADAGALRSLRRMAVQAVVASKYPLPGVVHLNARARKPLEPVVLTTSEEGKRWAIRAAEIRARAITSVVVPRETPEKETIAEVCRLLARAERGLIVCGPSTPAFGEARSAVFELARRTGFPLLAELPSQMRLATAPGVVVCDGFDAALRTPAFRKSHIPDVVVQIGGAPTSSGWEAFAEAHEATTRVVLSAHGAWADPSSTASHLLFGDTHALLDELVEQLAHGPRASAWGDELGRVAKAIAAATEQVLAEAEGLTEGLAARIVLDSLPPRSALMLGNSLPLRAAEAFARRNDATVSVLCQRGANGIDGLVAGSVGSALSLNEPFTLLLGDVSLLHDLSSLGLARRLETPFVVVVVQNNGGRIFEQLPLAAADAEPTADALRKETLAHVTTEHTIELVHAASLFGLGYARATTASELVTALHAAHAKNGATLVEVVVPPHGAVAEYRRLWQAVSSRVAVS